MVFADGENLGIAIQLFERGFSEARIEACLRCCRTLEEAVVWLSPTPCTAQSSASKAGASQRVPVNENSNPNQQTQRRRVRSKADSAFYVAAASAVGSKGTPAASATSPAPAAAVIAAVAKPAPSSEAGPDSTSAAGDAKSSNGLPIPPADSDDWWRKAAKRFQSAVAEMRASSSFSIAIGRPGVEDAAGASSSSETTPPRRPSLGGRAELSLPSSPRVGVEKRSDVTTPPQSASASVASEQSRRLTPGTSPRAMRLNDNEELCAICCNDVPAGRAVRLNCGHGWYCAQCVLRHTEARLQMGAASVTCPECNSHLAERVLRKLLPSEVIDRLLARSLEQAVSAAVDLAACPTPNCPMRVALEDGELPRLKCTHCKRESCLRCGAQPYHRGMTCEEYAEKKLAAKGSKKQQQQERERLEDERQLNEWMKETGTKQCPTCRMAVSKQNLQLQSTQYSECHKMVCRNCNTKFCFKCLLVLSDTVSCKCTRAEHGFVDPRTGKRLEHLRKGPGRPAGPAAKKARRG
eukprot:TRINITY_DN64102_c0_g1_i1.p1 TRINITY_DN64102_c0_g1~~TRINITY_DN64102_c0_g1_i1.p1  ORF type:complete len:551 (-),score=110.28 TRINITY_DN64102_c0_g1_i1:227-1792(-)